MTDEIKEPVTELIIEPSTTQPESINPAPKKSKKTVWIIAGVILVGICICLILCIAVFASGTGSVAKEQKPIMSVLDTFMKEMEAKNGENAYSLFSPRAQKQTPITDLEKMYEGNNFLLFENYVGLTIQNLNLTAAANIDPNLPQGNVANVAAIINYSDGFTGELTATLEKVDGNWKIHYVHVTIPPNKFAP